MVKLNEVIKKFKESCERARSEDDIKIATNIFLDFISSFFSLRKNAHSEVTSLKGGGRADSIYSDIIFEFKSLNKFSSKKGIKEAVFGRNKSDRGLFHYLINFSLDDVGSADEVYFKYLLNSKVGVGFDGKKFIFFRFKKSSSTINIFDEGKTKELPSRINPEQNLACEVDVIDDFNLGLKKLLLFTRSTQRKVLSANNLLSSFSSTSEITKTSMVYLYELLNSNLNTNKRVETLFLEWSRIFGDIYGKQETDFTKYKDELITTYSFPEDVDIRKSLFVLQTYYNIVIKLLIYGLLESLSDPTSVSKKPRNVNEFTSLFSGGFHTNYFIDNFFEIHFFEWFSLVKNLNISFLHDIMNELDTYETTASIIKPEVVGDVLKKVYSNLIPKGLRHLMGEYYTPDWLVDFTIEKSGFDFGLESSILDPTCGSGTFLTHIIKRFREKFDHNVTSNNLIKQITKNVVGFDINPIAVLSAKANYLLALGDITKLEENISIPVYMCDSILVPTVHAKQQEQSGSIKIKTVVGEFEIPVFESREKTDYFLKKVSNCIIEDYTSFDEFHDLIKSERKIFLNEKNELLAKVFYDKLRILHNIGKNGFWPIILKNSFAPLFSYYKFDVVIGNPPWISWKAMSDTYRELTLDIWLSYGIFEKNAYDKKTSHDDFAMAVTYVSIDHYLKNNGVVAFVLPQTFIKSLKGGEGFRKFKITRDSLDVPFSLNEVDDLLKISPFKGEAVNRTSVYVFEKNKQMVYPMHSYYEYYNLDNKNPVRYDDSFDVVKDKMNAIQLSAKPINSDNRSPWLTMKRELLENSNFYLGKSPYRARKGIEPCGAKGIYLIKINRSVGNLIEIENLIERSRLQKAKELGVHVGLVEKEFVYPMVGGRNFDKWGINSYIYMLVPHHNVGKQIYRGVPERELKTNYSKTFDWLFYFKDLLLETRIRSGKYFNAKSFPFYRLDNVGNYTFSKYKLLWREQSKRMTAAVISTVVDEFLGEKNIVTDSKVLYVSLESKAEAHYLCAILNSRLIGEIIEAYTIDVQKGVDIVKNIKIPLFDTENKLHVSLADLSLRAHSAYLEGNKDSIFSIESEIESLVLSVFN